MQEKGQCYVKTVTSCYRLFVKKRRTHMFNFLLTMVPRKLMRHHKSTEEPLTSKSAAKSPARSPSKFPAQTPPQSPSASYSSNN